MAFNLVRCLGLSAAVALALTLSACGSDDSGNEKSGSSGSSSGGSGSSSGGSGTSTGGSASSSAGTVGKTSCGLSTCEAGQYCDNGLCLNGCLTDANCGANQSCTDIDADTKVGTCKNQVVAPAKDCDAFCRKSLACMDPDFVMCMQVCEGSSGACVACVNDSNCGEGCETVCNR